MQLPELSFEHENWSGREYDLGLGCCNGLSDKPLDLPLHLVDSINDDVHCTKYLGDFFEELNEL